MIIDGKDLALEVSYFKAVKTSLVKLQQSGVKKKSQQEIDVTINQMLERSIISEEVIDVFDAMGMKKPDISIYQRNF